MTKRLTVPAAVMALAMLGMTACSSDSLQHAETARVTLQIAPDANQDSAIELDIVAVYDSDLLKTLLAMPARDWFSRRRQFELDYPKGWKAWNWQVVPGQIVPTQDIQADTGSAYGVLVFANYRTPGDHRARVTKLSSVVVQLQRDGFVVTGKE
ncbi:hypothetical protein [Insolitispirillum peregrinum]|uniref:hypothetical protein n=1 Tax=Insolitispirillum peregrinum TaxID=80876 RepID=UPI003611AE0F